MDIYREEILDHYENPRNVGEMEGNDVVTMRDSNASCGDMVQFFLRVSGSTGKRRVVDVKWKGIGCAITTAAASKLSEYLIGKKIEDIRKIGEEELVKDAIGFTVNSGRMKCLTLPVRVVKKILGS